MWSFVIPAVASLIGSLAGGRAEGKKAASQTALQQDQLKTQQYNTQQQAALQALLAAERGGLDRATLDLARRSYALTAPNQRGATAVRGDLMSRAQDMQISHPRATIPTITGGARPSMLSPETRQLGQSMTRNALAQQLKGDTFDPVPEQNWSGAVLAPPSPTPQPTSNWFDKFLGVAAPMAGVAGAVSTGITDSRTQQLIEGLLRQAQRVPLPDIPSTTTGFPTGIGGS